MELRRDQVDLEAGPRDKRFGYQLAGFSPDVDVLGGTPVFLEKPLHRV